MPSLMTDTMVSWLGEFHIWTLKNQTLIPADEIGCFSYHEKNEPADHQYAEEKAYYTASRDATWTPSNKRPERLRDTLREVEDLLAHHTCVRSVWINKRLLQITLSNGTMISFAVSQHTGDVDKIMIDKSLVGKLSGDAASEVLMSDSFLVVAHPDKTKLDYVYFTKCPNTKDHHRKLEKLAVYEPKVCQVELPGPIGRRLFRHFSCNIHQDLVLCWWPTASEEAWPWSPMTGEKERANMAVMAANGSHLGMISYIRTEGDPLAAMFSVQHGHRILTVEKCSGAGGELSVDVCMYELQKGKIVRLKITSIPVKSEVLCQGRAPTEDKIILGCKDSTLILFDEHKKSTQSMSSALVPSLIRWHPSGTVVAVASHKGHLQLFDMALNPLTFQLVRDDVRPTKTLDINNFFKSPPTLEAMEWSPMLEQPESVSECRDSLMLVCDRGPMAMVQYHLGVLSQGQLTPLAMVNQYVKHRQMDASVNLLASMNWNQDGQMCYACLSAISNHLLRQPLNSDREAQLEAALGTFYAPSKPLAEVTVLEFRDPVGKLARRFFHHLLRYTRFDKAFLLAVDIGARDLFMDIHYVALDKGESALAEVARRKADQIETETLDIASLEDYEESGDSEEGDSLEDSEEDDSDDYLPEAPPIPPPRPPGRAPPPSGFMGPPPLPPRQPAYTLPPQDPRFVPQHRSQESPGSDNWQKSYMYMPEAALQQLEEELSAEMFSDYTAALLDDIPPPQLAAQEPSDEQSAQEASSSVKVIHFGIV